MTDFLFRNDEHSDDEPVTTAQALAAGGAIALVIIGALSTSLEVITNDNLFIWGIGVYFAGWGMAMRRRR